MIFYYLIGNYLNLNTHNVRIMGYKHSEETNKHFNKQTTSYNNLTKAQFILRKSTSGY